MTTGAESTVSVAAVVVAEPKLLVKTARYSLPLWPAVVTMLSVVDVAPATLAKVEPPFVLTCHCTVGAGVPLAAAVNVAVWPALTASLTGFVVTTGAESTVIEVAFVPLSSVTVGLVVPVDVPEEKVVLAVPLAIATVGGLTEPSVPGAKVRSQAFDAARAGHRTTVGAESGDDLGRRHARRSVGGDRRRDVGAEKLPRASRVMTVVEPPVVTTVSVPAAPGKASAPHQLLFAVRVAPVLSIPLPLAAVSWKNRLPAMVRVPPPAWMAPP